MASARFGWALLLLAWTWKSGCDTAQPQEEEIFHSEKQNALSWTSKPPKQWGEIRLAVGAAAAVPMLQACTNGLLRTTVSQWMKRKDAHYLLMDITFTQEEELDGQLRPLQVFLYESDTPMPSVQRGGSVVELRSPEPFTSTTTDQQILGYLRTHTAVDLGLVQSKGFQLALSYSGPCVLVTSIRLYYRRCPDVTDQLVSFNGTGAGLALAVGLCVKGAVEVSPPARECTLDGLWGPLQGRCSCRPGHQVLDGTCRPCHMGSYKPAEGDGGCRPCPANTRTREEGSVMCTCVQGFSRAPSEPHDLGCTRPPSAPVNLTAHHSNDSALALRWDPPHDWGGRQEMAYHIQCEQEEEPGGLRGPCPDAVVILLGPSSTSASISGLNPQSNYRLSVQAWNSISTLQGAPPSSTATIAIHKWKASGVTAVTPDFNSSVVPQHQRLATLAVAVLLGVLLLLPLVLVVAWVCKRNKSRFVRGHDPLLVNAVVSYRRPQGEVVLPQPSNKEDEGVRLFAGVEGVVQLLEGFSDRLMLSLKDVLVERNKLTLGKELGRGAFGLVYEGVFTPDDGVVLKVAVKTMKVGIHSHQDLDEFLREAELMQNFDHENVVRLLGVTLQREQDCPLPVPLVILPYLKHGDLRRFLIDTRYGDVPLFVPHQSLLRFMMDIAAGMEYLSLQGFLHRDLAARNCMLGDDLRVCVADFGLSKRIYSSNYYRQNAVVRVPIKWMAMESLSESLYTTKTDVWSFGVTMWEIVSRGRTPYPGVQNSEMLDLLQAGDRLKAPADCDHRLYEVMRSCWDEDPVGRPSFSQLLQVLKDLLAELPELEASLEVSYINQVLEVSAAGAASQSSPEPGGDRCENTYLPSPVGAPLPPSRGGLGPLIPEEH